MKLTASHQLKSGLKSGALAGAAIMGIALSGLAGPSHAQETTPPAAPPDTPPAPQQAPQQAPQPAAPQIDAAAQALMTQMLNAYKGLKSYSGKMDVTVDGVPNAPKFHFAISFQAPNRLAVLGSTPDGATKAIANGKNLFVATSADKTRYMKLPSPPDRSAVLPILMASGAGLAPGVAPLLAGENPLSLFGDNVRSVRLGEAATLDGTATDTVVVELEKGPAKGTAAYAIAKTDHLLRRVALTQERNGQTMSITETHSNVKANPPLAAVTFTFKPQPGAKPVESLEPPTYDPRLTVGAKPLAFSVKDTAGKPISLAQFKGKVLLLDFWASWCGPCVAEMPNVVAAYKKYHSKGFDVVGVSLDEDKAKMQSFITAQKMPWRQIFDGRGWQNAVAATYKVQAIPFALLIGRDGKIAAVNVRGEQLDAAIRKALAKK